jgi:hypothetical protein
VAGPVDGTSGHYLSPTYFFEFNPSANTLSAISNPPTNGGPPYVGRFMLLPTGQVLFANGSSNIQVYTPTGGPDPMWKPNITAVPTTLIRGRTYTLNGRQINGLSQAVAYGDDATSATNYPIIRLRNAATGHVFYCRTMNHSTLGVNTGTVVHTTQFQVPAGAELGASDITVIANGIASDPVRVNVALIKKVEIKELKVEIKEIKELEVGPVASGTPAAGADPDLLAVVRMLAERADKAAEEAESGSVPFISEQERPSVGEAATGPIVPASNPVKKQPDVGSEGQNPHLPPSSPNKGRG